MSHGKNKSGEDMVHVFVTVLQFKPNFCKSWAESPYRWIPTRSDICVFVFFDSMFMSAGYNDQSDKSISISLNFLETPGQGPDVSIILRSR